MSAVCPKEVINTVAILLGLNAADFNLPAEVSVPGLECPQKAHIGGTRFQFISRFPKILIFDLTQSFFPEDVKI